MKKISNARGLVALMRMQHGKDAEAFALARAEYFRDQRPDLAAAAVWDELASALGALPIIPGDTKG